MRSVGAGSDKGSTIEDGAAAQAVDGVRRRWVTGLMKPAFLLSGLIAAGLLAHALPSVRHVLVSRELLALGWRGWIIFLCLGTAIGAVGLPRQAVGFAGGFIYGWLGGVVLAIAANMLAALADLLWARLVGQSWARRRLRASRAARLSGFVSARPFTAILTLRLLPVGSSLLVSLLAGVLGVRIVPFLTATLLGSLPQTVIFVLVGSGSRIGHLTQIGLAVALFVASGASGVLLFRRVEFNSDAKTGKSSRKYFW